MSPAAESAMSASPSRRPLHERSDSDANTRTLAAVRLVPITPPRLLGGRDDAFSRAPLPAHPSHILSIGKGKDRDDAHALQPAFQRPSKAEPPTSSSGSSAWTAHPTHTAHQPPQYGEPATGSPGSKPKPVPKKRLHIHKDNKTFSLVAQDNPPTVEDGAKSPTLSTQSSNSLFSSDAGNAGVRSNSIISCRSDTSSTYAVPATSATEIKQLTPTEPISSSPWNYQFVGGLRKVPKTPDLKQKAAVRLESPLPPLSETIEAQSSPSQELSEKISFHSTETATTASENTNYRVYSDNSASNSELALVPLSSSDSNHQLLEGPSPASSVIHRPQTSSSEFENYDLLGDSSPSASYISLAHPSKYSHESLVVPPLNPRSRRSNENLGYYKSRSRESLRTGSLTSISTVLSQQEAARATVGTGALIQLPILSPKLTGTSSWAKLSTTHPTRSLMIETPHQWSSQLSTVPSVSESGTDRGSRSWSDENGRRSSGFLSNQSRNSRQMVQEEADSRSRSDSLEPPQRVIARSGPRHPSSSSIRMVGDQDEYGDGITDMQDLRRLPSRNRLSGLYSVPSSENGRTNTMLSSGSSRANSLLASTIPTWARLYYGSGERRYLGGAPGSSTAGTNSRASSFHSGSPSPGQFPLDVYSPRRRPREITAYGGRSGHGSMEITPVSQVDSDGRLIRAPYSRRLRTWSMSSLWSPHLRTDRRATRHSVWEAPSVNWSTEANWFGRRNVQIVMFIAGFIFPFAWMIAAFLPLPINPIQEMRERNHSASSTRDDSHHAPDDYTRQFGPIEEARYESAKWWRNINRCMSLVGLLIIAIVIVLVVLSVKQGW